MVTAVFLIGVVNLGLGFALALVLDRAPTASLPSFDAVRKHVTRLGAGASSATAGLQAAPHNAPSNEDVPEWAAILTEEQIDVSSPLESLLWITKLQTDRMRARLIALDKNVAPGAQVDADALRSIVAQWQTLLSDWTQLAAEHKAESDEIGSTLEERLLDLAFQMQSSYGALIDESDESEELVSDQLLSLIDAANATRDGTDEMLARWLVAHERLPSLPDRFKQTGEHGTLTRFGLDGLLADWWQSDPQVVRLASLVMVDVDRFSRLNEAVGPRLGDVALQSIGELLHGLVRQTRGFDRVARISGQRFLLFLGDTSAKNAMKGAERVRQTLEAAAFRFGSETTSLTTSCSVLAIERDESSAVLIQRLEEGLSEVKKAGRNLTFCDAGEGWHVVELPQYQVNENIVDLGAN